MLTKGNTNLEIIQGDTFSLTIRLENVDLDTIDKVYFSCNELGICKEFVRNEDVFELDISCDETCNFEELICCYDLTVKFIGNKTKTIEYRGKLTVLEKVNKVTL